MSITDKVLGTILLFVVSGCIGAVVLAVGYNGRSNLAQAQRASCRSSISDRIGSMKVREVQAKSAQIIADDIFQSRKTREARENEAIVLRLSVSDLRLRVDPKNGGKLVCNKAFPLPSLF